MGSREGAAGGDRGPQVAAGRGILCKQQAPSPLLPPRCGEGLKFTVCAKTLQEINARKEKKKFKKA